MGGLFSWYNFFYFLPSELCVNSVADLNFCFPSHTRPLCLLWYWTYCQPVYSPQQLHHGGNETLGFQDLGDLDLNKSWCKRQLMTQIISSKKSRTKRKMFLKKIKRNCYAWDQNEWGNHKLRQMLMIKSHGWSSSVIYILSNLEISKTKEICTFSCTYYLVCSMFHGVYYSVKLNIIGLWKLNKSLNSKHI